MSSPPVSNNLEQARKLERQQREWPLHLKGAADGNPFATLCRHCCGRHAPPRDEICPHESIEVVKARISTRKDTGA